MQSYIKIDNINKTSSTFYYIPKFLNSDEERVLLHYMNSTQDFVATPSYTMNISRLQKWFHPEKKYFCPIWKDRFPQWESFEIDDTINHIQDKVQQYINNMNINIKKPNINSCLINKYPDGKYFIAPHRDSELSFGKEPTIINLSLGATRPLLFENDKETFSFDLESGSLFIMGGASQSSYVHSIKKSSCNNVRYSLTFREFIL